MKKSWFYILVLLITIIPSVCWAQFGNRKFGQGQFGQYRFNQGQFNNGQDNVNLPPVESGTVFFKGDTVTFLGDTLTYTPS